MANDQALTKKEYEAYYDESLAFSLKEIPIDRMIEEMRAASARVEALENDLKSEKARLQMLQEFAVPETLRMAGAPLDRFSLGLIAESAPVGFTFQTPLFTTNGHSTENYLRVGKDVHVSISPTSQDEAERWLASHGYGDKVSRKEVVTIHVATLKKAIREAIEAKENLTNLQTFFHIHQYEKAEIKVSRKKNSSTHSQPEHCESSNDEQSQ